MKRIKVGDVYSAHLYIDDERHTSDGCYHFEILTERECSKYVKGKWVKFKFFLGLKLGVSYGNDSSQCYWFDNNGINKETFGGISKTVYRFELKRKIKKTPRIWAEFEGFDYE